MSANRKSSNMARITKGDVFICPKFGDLVIANSYAVDKRDDGTVAVPILAAGNKRASRRRYDATQRVSLMG